MLRNPVKKLNAIAAHLRGRQGGASKSKRVFATMEEETDLSDLEFFLVIYQDSWDKLVHKSHSDAIALHFIVQSFLFYTLMFDQFI
jgi:hypothetical protein